MMGAMDGIRQAPPLSAAEDAPAGSAPLAARYARVRALTVALVEPLGDADATLQSMPDASPAKWHLAHTSWFFETFLLRERLPGFARFADDWPFLFNSYYEGEGPRIARDARGMLSRPSLAEVLAYRAHVDAGMARLLGDPACAPLVELGLAHEQQHQELLLTDIKHALLQNPLGPAMWLGLICRDRGFGDGDGPPTQPSWREHPGGIVEIGHAGPGFAFDNEGPRHEVMLQPFALASRLVSNREWAAFVADGGYANPALWLADGWAWVQREGIDAPLYWRDDEWFSHMGWVVRESDAPVTHISYYEADAYATWAGARLPTEPEWEAVAQADDPTDGVQLDHAAPRDPMGSDSLLGVGWLWSRSAYLPYPRFKPAAGAVGEYNGKFMSGQFVLKGASCATPRGHSRASYRNFFYPHQRWQFTGLRLAKDL
jgi:ergothioneine biosynthesis protein EgtB